MNHKAKVLVDCRCQHGEGPFWWQETLVWLDIMGKTIYRLVGKDVTAHRMDFSPTTIVAHADGGYVVSSFNAILRLDEQFQVLEEIAVFDFPADVRFNDGKCDPSGRFWVGTMGTSGQSDAGTLFCVEAAGGGQKSAPPNHVHGKSGYSVSARLEKVAISNGICWTDDTMYYTDTSDRRIKVFDYHKSGRVDNMRILYTANAYPDGMCLDANGNIWIALWEGFGVICIDSQTGKEIARVEVPVPLVSAVTFGGKNMKTLFITTSRLGLSEEASEAHPLSGSLFSVDLNVGGAMMFLFRE